MEKIIHLLREKAVALKDSTKEFFRKFRKTIFSSIIVISLFIGSFFLLLQGVQNEKLAEKFVDMQARLELIGFQAEHVVKRDADFNQYHSFYVDNLVRSMQFIDRQQATFAAVYDKELTNISERHPTYKGSPFEPLKVHEFIESVNNNIYGTLNIEWEDLANNVPRRTVYVCYRWVFTEDSDPCLITIGISKHSLKSPSLNFVIGITYAVFLITFIILFGFLIFMVKDLYTHYRKLK